MAQCSEASRDRDVWRLIVRNVAIGAADDKVFHDFLVKFLQMDHLVQNEFIFSLFVLLMNNLILRIIIRMNVCMYMYISV